MVRLMEFMLIRRISDRKFLSKYGWVYTDDFSKMAIYQDEDRALALARQASLHAAPSEVVYMTTFISDVKV